MKTTWFKTSRLGSGKEEKANVELRKTCFKTSCLGIGKDEKANVELRKYRG